MERMEIHASWKEKQWVPRTDLGKKVLEGKFQNLDQILEQGHVILEPEIVDAFIPDIKHEIVYIGGSPGKGGGIRRTATKRTARMHKSGRRYKLTAMVIVGDGHGIAGLGVATSKEHRLALEKAAMQARLNVIRIRKGCGSWECACGGDHSIPFKTKAKAGSIIVELLPAPKGTGIVANESVKKMLRLAGIQDVWVKTEGQTATRTSLIVAVFQALKNLNRTKGDEK